MKFSVILPCYNVEKYLNECVESILKQTFKDYEIILVDDGAKDSTPQICDEYAQKYSFIKVVHQPNAGLSEARNTGTKHAEGDYIVYVDSDDYFNGENVLQKIAERTVDEPDVIAYKFIEYNEFKGSYSDCSFNFDIKHKNGSLAEKYLELIDKDAYYNSAWSKAIKRSILIKNSIEFERGLLGEDNEWYYHVVMAANTLELIDEPLYVYRRRPGSITTTTKRKNLTDMLYILEKWTLILNDHVGDERANVVLGSLAKQFCSAVILYVGLQDVNDLYPELKKYLYLLKYSSNKRVVIFRWAIRLLTLKGFIKVLRVLRMYLI